MQVTRLFLATCCLALMQTQSWAEVPTGEAACGVVSGPGAGVDMGPFDYRNPPMNGKLRIVEQHHFTNRVATLRGGQSTATIGTDIDFTLRYFPNHVRALAAMAKLAEQEKSDPPRGSTYSVGCWFDRAVRWASDDPQVRLFYGIWLARRGEKELARQQLKFAEDAEYLSANMTYNMGLAYFQIGDYEKALWAAHRAYQGGFNLPGLKAMLSRVGKWQDPPTLVRDTNGTLESDSVKDSGH